MLKSAHNLQNAVTLAGAYIHSKAVCPLQQGLHCRHMSLGQVLYVDVITHASAVWGVVVITVNFQNRALSHCNLSNIGHQIVWWASGVFANQTTGVCAHWVEVPQNPSSPTRVGDSHGGKHLFTHQLCVTIGDGVAARKIFGNGHSGRVAINRGAA